MPFDSILWDLPDDPEGNVQHCAEHGITMEEVEEVFQNISDSDVSRSLWTPCGLWRNPGGEIPHGGVRRDRRRHGLPNHGLRRSEESITMKRIIRERQLTPTEAAQNKAIREQVAQELPELITRHQERLASLDQLQELLIHLKAAREAKGLSLSQMMELTGMDSSALSKLETGQRANPTVETLVRYAEAVGKRLVVSLADAA